MSVDKHYLTPPSAPPFDETDLCVSDLQFLQNLRSPELDPKLEFKVYSKDFTLNILKHKAQKIYNSSAHFVRASVFDLAHFILNTKAPKPVVVIDVCDIGDLYMITSNKIGMDAILKNPSNFPKDGILYIPKIEIYRSPKNLTNTFDKPHSLSVILVHINDQTPDPIVHLRQQMELCLKVALSNKHDAVCVGNFDNLEDTTRILCDYVNTSYYGYFNYVSFGTQNLQRLEICKNVLCEKLKKKRKSGTEKCDVM